MRASSSAARPLRAAAADRVLGQQALAGGEIAPGGGGQGQRLQQGYGGGQVRGPDHRGRAGHGPVRAHQEGQRGQQFRDIQVYLPPGGGQLGEAVVDQPRSADPVDHHVDGPQGPVGQVRVVQPGHGRPESLQQVVGDLPGREQVQRAPPHQVHDQQRGAAGCRDDTVHPRHVDARPFGQQADQRLMLDGLPQRGGGSPVAHALEPGGPVGPVQQVGLTLIRAERLDEQAPPVRGDRSERP